MIITTPICCDDIKDKIKETQKKLNSLTEQYINNIKFSVLQCYCGHFKHISDITLYENFWWEAPEHYGMGMWHHKNYEIKCDACDKSYIIEVPKEIGVDSFKEIVKVKED